MGELVWINGSIVPKGEAKVSVFDRGFLYGDGLFETMRSYGGKVFRLDEHLERLFKSSELIKLEIPFGRSELKGAVYKILEANEIGDGSVRLTVTRGEGGGGLDPEGCGPPSVVIVAKDAIPYSQSDYDRGFRAVVVNIKRTISSPISRIKSLNFLDNMLAKMEARACGVDEGIILNTDGYLAEATVSNIFLVKDKNLITPSEGCGILAGITRGAVLGLGPELGLEVLEREVELDELFEAEEAFLTNSLMEVMPLVEVDGLPIGSGRPGEVTCLVHKAYRELVKTQTENAAISKSGR